jgi:hypothetical protein
VTRDAIAACALARDAEAAAHMAPHPSLTTIEDHWRYQAHLAEASEFAAAHCGALSREDAERAMLARGGCYAFGMLEQTFMIAERIMQVGRAGMRLGRRAPTAIGILRFVK